MVTVSQMAKTLSASPLVMRRCSPPRRTTTERRLRLKSNGISSTFSYSDDGRVLVLQDRVVQRALDARLKVTVQVDEAQDVVVVLPLDVHVPVEHDLAFGQGARLVAAEDLHAAEVLDGRKLLDEDLLPRHPPRALRQRDRDDHRHHLRRHPDCERDREEKRLQQRALENDVDQQDEQHQQHDHPRDHQPEVAYATAELGLRRPHRQAAGQSRRTRCLCPCKR